MNDVENFREIPINYSSADGTIRLCGKTRNIACEAKKNGSLPYLNFRLGKHLRDMIADPGIEIDFSENFENKLDTITIFEHLDLPNLEAIEAQISAWIDAVCKTLDVPRFTDTKQTVTELGKCLGKVNEVREI